MAKTRAKTRKASVKARRWKMWAVLPLRNVWNPLAPVCSNCGKSIGELLGIFKLALDIRVGGKRAKRKA